MLLWMELWSRLEAEVGVTGLVGLLVAEEGSGLLPSFVRFFLRKPRLGKGIKSYFRVDSRARPGPSNWGAGETWRRGPGPTRGGGETGNRASARVDEGGGGRRRLSRLQDECKAISKHEQASTEEKPIGTCGCCSAWGKPSSLFLSFDAGYR